jgi:flagellar P-ring protein precursor FlgI
MFKNQIAIKFCAGLALIFFLSGSAEAARIKDLSGIKGVRSNQLIGLGLVIGLTGTGDSATNVFFSI